MAAPVPLPVTADGRNQFCLSQRMKKRTKRIPTKRRWWPRPAISGAPRKPRSRISRAISSAKKKKKWPTCNSPAAPAARWKRSRRFPIRKPAAMIRVLAAVERSTKNATVPDLPALFIASASAAIWPEHLGKYERKSVTGSSPPPSTADENGRDEAEQASYGSFTRDRRSDSRTLPALTQAALGDAGIPATGGQLSHPPAMEIVQRTWPAW